MRIEDLDEWQQKILETQGNILLCTGRQTGKTTVFAAKAALKLVNQKKCKIIVVSLTEDQAQLIIIMVLDFLEKNYKQWLRKAKKPTKNAIWLNNGSEIQARPVGNTGASIRGFTGDVLIIDEASRMPPLMWASALPTLLTTGGEIWMCSTPAGKDNDNYFYKCYLNRDNKYTVVHCNAEDVIKNRKVSDSWNELKREASLKHLEERKRDLSNLEYRQEYLAEFVDDLRRLFSDELIEMCCIAQRQPYNEGSKYYLGCDFARLGGDQITYEVVELMNSGWLLHTESIVKKMQLTTETIKDILALDRQYKFKKIFVDSGGLGAAMFDQLLVTSQTMNKVVAIDNAKKSMDSEEGKRRLLKEDLYMNLLRLMERKEIQLLKDEDVMLSLRSMQYEMVVKPGEKSRVRIWGAYSHICEGLIRAAWAVSSKSLNLWVQWK